MHRIVRVKEEKHYPIASKVSNQERVEEAAAACRF